MKKVVQRKPRRRPSDIAVQNLGVIAARVMRYWPLLPINVRVCYELDDMIQEVALHVVRKATKYNKRRAAPTTFVYRCADNKCKELLSFYSTQMRTATIPGTNVATVVLSISSLQVEDDSTPATLYEAPFDAPTPEPISLVELREAASRIEKLIAVSSIELKAFIAQFLRGQRPPATRRLIVELTEACKGFNISFGDLQLVYLRSL